MRYPGKKYLRLSWCWEGFVEDVGPNVFWVRVIPTNHKGRERTLEIDRGACPRLRVNEYFTMQLFRAGRRRPYVVVRRKWLPPLTQKQLDDIRAQAVEWAERLRELAE